ncbi:MAG: hypothetical protein JXN63_04615 [Candidatus Delongbacteria bacterium]|nr:hypothetical protein [Candidatus Delongbacteria bacterium]
MGKKLNLLALAENEMRSINGGYGDLGMECQGVWHSCDSNVDWYDNVIDGITGVPTEPKPTK